MNQVILVGRLTRDPDLRQTADGISILNITLAVNRPYKNANGENDADFVSCTLWRRVAENTAMYCEKGSMIGLTGKIQTRSYENAERKRVYVTEVLAESVQFMSLKRKFQEESDHLNNEITKEPHLDSLNLHADEISDRQNHSTIHEYHSNEDSQTNIPSIKHVQNEDLSNVQGGVA